MPVTYRERLTVPVAWWLLAVGFAASLGVAMGYYLGWIWGSGAALLAMVVAAGIFFSAATVIEVRPGLLLVGRSEIDHRYIARGQALDESETRERAGTGADARAHLVLRPYVSTAVEITLDDPADRVPYWLVSTRHAPELAAALNEARSTAERTVT
jgi:hypothetical protein